LANNAWLAWLLLYISQAALVAYNLKFKLLNIRVVEKNDEYRRNN